MDNHGDAGDNRSRMINDDAGDNPCDDHAGANPSRMMMAR
jgi:hypothetical protein